MDIENPLHKEDEIPEAKLVYIEVMGELMRESLRETYSYNNNEDNSYNNDNNNTISVEISLGKCIYQVVKGCCACFLGLVCCFGFIIFLAGPPLFS